MIDKTLGFVAGALVAVAFVLFLIAAASARDLDRHYATQDPALHSWFDQLASGKGLCCSFADGVSVEDVDWDTATVASADGKSEVVYRVRINGRWIVVPPEAVITVPNKYGAAVVWPYQVDGVTQIRCFIPGAGS